MGHFTSTELEIRSEKVADEADENRITNIESPESRHLQSIWYLFGFVIH